MSGSDKSILYHNKPWGREHDHLLLPYFRAKKNICKIYGKSSILKFYNSNTYLHTPSANSSLFLYIITGID